MSAALTLGYLATAVGLYSSVPQVVRAVRTRSVQGLSWASLVMGLVTCVLWGVYGVAISDGVQIVNNTVALALLGALAVVAYRVEDSIRVAPAVVAVLGAVLAAVPVAVWVSPFAVALAGTVIGSARMVPQVRLAMSRAPLWGLDPWAVLLGVVAPAVWFAYGAVAGDVAVMVASVIALVLNGVVLGHRLPPRRTLASLAGGRLGPVVARSLRPVAARFPYRGELAPAA